MYRAERTAVLPPHTERLPRNAPLSRFNGATPTRAATWPRFRLPSSGRCVSSVEDSTGPTPGTLRSRSSWGRHMGDERISLLMSLSRPSICCLSHRMCSWMRGLTRLVAWRRRFRSDVTISSSCRRRSTRARSSRVSSSGSGRTGGLIASANCASTWASMASVLANLPVARAKLRTWRGLTNDTGRPATSSSPATNISNPPLASSTNPQGSRGTSLSIIAAMPSASLLYCRPSPVGRIATSNCLAETSIPMYTSPRSEITTPPVWVNVLLTQAQSCNIRPRLVGAHNCSGSGSWGRDDPAVSRSTLTKNETICHVHN